jgi:hypothetical protein
MSVFGEHFSVARWLAAGVFCLTLMALYAAALELLDRRRAAIFGLSLLSFKFIGWPSFTAYLYSDVAFAGACGAVALFLGHGYRGASRRLVATGACAGIAVICKQNLGIYLAGALAALVVLPELLLGVTRARPSDRWRELAALAAGLAVPSGLLVGYAAAHGVFGAMIESGLIRPFTDYAPTSALSFSAPLAWWEFGALKGSIVYAIGPLFSIWASEELPDPRWWWFAGELFTRCMYLSIPVAFGWAALQAWLDRRRGPASALAARRGALALLALACFLSALPRADLFHVVSIYPVVWLLIFSHVAADHARDPRAIDRVPWRSATAVGLLLLACTAFSVVFLSRFDHRLTLDRIDRRIAPRMAWVESVVRYVEDEVPPGGPLFVYGHEAYLYFLSGRFSPWPFSQLYPGQAGRDGGRRVIEALEAADLQVAILGNAYFPSVLPLKSYTPLIDAYLTERFAPTDEPYERFPSLPGGDPPGVVKRRAPP